MRESAATVENEVKENQKPATALTLDSTFTSEKLGIRFKYPSAWGPVAEGIENCTYDVEAATESNPCEHVTLGFSGVPGRTSFLSSYSLLAAENPPERDAYWGDRAGAIRDENFLKSYCDGLPSASWPRLSSTDCKTYTNQHGVLVVRSFEETGYGGKALMFYIKSSHPVFFGLVLSTDRLAPNTTSATGSTNLEEAEDVLNALVDSLEFLETEDENITGGSLGTVPVFLVSIEGGQHEGSRRVEGSTCFDSLVPVNRSVSKTTPHVRDALQELLFLPILQKDGDPTPCFGNTDCYEGTGLYNALYQSHLTIDTLEITNGHVDVHLSGEVVTGGVCDSPRFISQVRETILQFSDINSASVWINDIPMEKGFSEK